MRTIAILLACLSCTGQGHRIDLLQGRMQTESQEGYRYLEKASDTMSRHASSDTSKQYQSISNGGLLPPLKAFAKARSAFVLKPRVAQDRPSAGWRLIEDKPSGTLDTQYRIIPCRAVARHADSHMAVTKAQRGGGDDDFEVAMPHLAHTCKEVQELRKRVIELEIRLQNSIDEQDFPAAIRLRDEIREVRSKNPETLMSSLSTQMQAAVEGERYNEAAKYRDQLRTLKRFLPEYQLCGSWNLREGFFVWAGSAEGAEAEIGQNGSFRMRYEGDILTVAGMDGTVIFSADISKPVSDSEGPQLDFNVEGLPEEVFRKFLGEGTASGTDSAPGALFLMDDRTICCWWLGDKKAGVGGGEEKVLQPIGGERAGVSGEGLQGRGGSALGAFLIFDKVCESNEDGEQYKTTLEKVLKLRR